MSSTPEGQESRHQDARASEIQFLATELHALVEQYEAALSVGQVSPEFEERLGQFRQAAERLISSRT